MKKLFILFSFLFIPIIVLLFVQCSESTIDPNDQDTALALYSGGASSAPIPNNLSFPGLLADGYTLIETEKDKFRFEIPFIYPEGYDYVAEGLTYEEWITATSSTWYAQKECRDIDADGDIEANIWQAQFAYVEAPVDVDTIDWGDNMESFSPTQGKPFRVEFGLYKNLVTPMTGYTMALLDNPSSPDEIQGTNSVPYSGYVATIASDKATLVIQHYTVDASTLTWNGSSWVGADTPESVVFGVELNVAGKLIYGAAQKGWKPAQTGNYRITFYLPGSEVNLSNATLGSAPTDQTAFPIIDQTNNITYVDIVSLPRSGGK